MAVLINYYEGQLITDKLLYKNIQTCLNKAMQYKIAYQCSFLTLAFNIPGSGGDEGGLFGGFETEVGTCAYMLEPSPPSVGLSVVLSLWDPSQSFIALRT